MLITEMAFEVPVFSSLLTSAGHIPVSKNHSGEQIVDAAVTRLKQGGTIGLFPEGSLSPSIGQFSRTRTGAARIAIKSGAPIIPVGIHLSEGAYLRRTIKTSHYENTARWAYRGDYYLTVGKALHFDGDVEDREHGSPGLRPDHGCNYLAGREKRPADAPETHPMAVAAFAFADAEYLLNPLQDGLYSPK